MPYEKLETEEYLLTLEKRGYTEEEIENVRKVRDEWDYMPYEQYKLLIEQGLLKRTVKLKFPRSIWFCEETGGFYYLNHWSRHFVNCAHWKETE